MVVVMRERWRRTSPTSSSDAPLRSMSVARLWRSRCEPTYFCGGFRPVFLNASLQHGVYDLGILEGRMVRRLRRDEQRARVAGSSISDVVDDRFAHVRGKRHAVVQFALTPDEDFARAPVDVVELDRDNLGRAKSEPRHEQQHRVVAPPNGVVGANRLDQPLDLFGLEIARQMVGAGGDARQAVGEIAPRSCRSRTGT